MLPKHPQSLESFCPRHDYRWPGCCAGRNTKAHPQWHFTSEKMQFKREDSKFTLKRHFSSVALPPAWLPSAWLKSGCQRSLELSWSSSSLHWITKVIPWTASDQAGIAPQGSAWQPTDLCRNGVLIPRHHWTQLECGTARSQRGTKSQQSLPLRWEWLWPDNFLPSVPYPVSNTPWGKYCSAWSTKPELKSAASSCACALPKPNKSCKSGPPLPPDASRDATHTHPWEQPNPTGGSGTNKSDHWGWTMTTRLQIHTPGA